MYFDVFCSALLYLGMHRNKKDGDHDRICPPKPVSAFGDAWGPFRPPKTLPNMVHVTQNFVEMRNCQQKSEDQDRRGPYLVAIKGAEMTTIPTEILLPNMVMVIVPPVFIKN